MLGAFFTIQGYTFMLDEVSISPNHDRPSIIMWPLRRGGIEKRLGTFNG